MPKAMLVVMDGLGDRPIKDLGDLTPLEAARTPNLDALAVRGVNGVMNAIGVGLRPGSDTSHLAILGYDIDRFYTGRGTTWWWWTAGPGASPTPGLLSRT
jgi:2,3-bisphosphoglycerate-independent phosphoglycerate mutase